MSRMERDIRANMSFLAADVLQGRGSATRDEHLAALYTASRFQALGLEPAGDPTGDGGGYIQKTPLPEPLPISPRMQKYWQRFENVPRKETWNTIGILRGTDPKLKNEVILLTAHQDHLGIGTAVHGDSIYNGADDDASGTIAVLELARMLSQGKRPRRTIVFALFDAEEMGGLGDAAFLAHPPVPLTSIVANLEFEMIGRPDPAVPEGTLWLTGFNRSTLGAELVKRGAHLVADPHPTQHFFRRSDNYALAKDGIIAHTVSSFGLHQDYHQPSDDIAHINFTHMTNAITSMVAPVRWLANTNWKPQWNPGGKPASDGKGLGE
ncbi:MAG: M28 family peptidase [Acidobacteriaceae bacterium]